MRTCFHAIASAAFLLAAALQAAAQGGASTLPASAGATAPRPAKGEVVYSTDFQGPLGKQWSAIRAASSPKGGRTFLGQFGSETVSLTLKDLPAHTYVRVSFDLLIINTWDGSHEGNGPDHWQLSVKDGPQLIHTTFSIAANWPSHNQAFPDIYPFGSHSGRLGAAAEDSLGYQNDLVYNLSVVFPHREKLLDLGFSAANLQDVSDESWGLDNVKVEVFAEPPAVHLTDEQLGKLSAELVGADPVAAHKAMWQLIGAGDRAVGFLRARALAKPEAETVADSGEIAALISRLDDDQWRVRDRATRELRERIDEAEPQIRKALQGDCSAELRARLEEILKSSGRASQARIDPRVRVLWALRIIGSPKAEKLLRELAAHLVETSRNPAVRQRAAEVLRRREK
jgi:hypothetical protein